YFYIDVTDSMGVVTNWACEGAGPGALSRRGFQKGDIKFGDSIIVDGYLSMNGAKIVDARRVSLPDGRVVNGGTPGDGGLGDPTRASRAGCSRVMHVIQPVIQVISASPIPTSIRESEWTFPIIQTFLILGILLF